MEITCYHCHSPNVVPDQASHFTCYRCGAPNVPQRATVAPAQQPTKPAPNRGAGLMVFGLFVAAAVVGFITRAIGLGIGGALVLWSAVSFSGKIRSPLELLTANVASGTGLRVASVVLGTVAIVFGGVGIQAHRSYVAKQDALTAQALEIVPEYAAELDRVEQLIDEANGNRAKLSEAREALRKAEDIAYPYVSKLSKIPKELERLEDRRKELKARLDPPKQTEAECRAEKQVMLDACIPVCTADPNLMGEAFDDCLRGCAREKFGKELKMCTPG